MRAAIALLAIVVGCQPSRPPSASPKGPSPEVVESVQRASAARARGELDAALREYRFVLDSSASPDYETLARRAIVEIELSRIEGGDHSSLPQPRAESNHDGSGYPVLILENHTKSALHVFLHGAVDQIIDLASDSTSQFPLSPGQVRIGIRGDDPSSLPLLGVHTYNVWEEYRVSIGPIQGQR